MQLSTRSSNCRCMPATERPPIAIRNPTKTADPSPCFPACWLHRPAGAAGQADPYWPSGMAGIHTSQLRHAHMWRQRPAQQQQRSRHCLGCKWALRPQQRHPHMQCGRLPYLCWQCRLHCCPACAPVPGLWPACVLHPSVQQAHTRHQCHRQHRLQDLAADTPSKPQACSQPVRL
jgi:hypothetical protein